MKKESKYDSPMLELLGTTTPLSLLEVLSLNGDVDDLGYGGNLDLVDFKDPWG